MPWPHCDLQVMDDQSCPKCGITKAEWTMKVQVTRVFRLSARSCKVVLYRADGSFADGVEYRIGLPDGTVSEGLLNPAGYVKVDSKVAGDATVEFPGRTSTVWVEHPDLRRGEGGAYLCKIGPDKYEFKLVEAATAEVWCVVEPRPALDVEVGPRPTLDAALEPRAVAELIAVARASFARLEAQVERNDARLEAQVERVGVALEARVERVGVGLEARQSIGDLELSVERSEEK